MYSRQIIRHFFSSSGLWSSVNKADLAKLRKKTGYTFANCKKALELHKDIESAERWLKEQAQALGWSKAVKLQGRTTQQGLIGVSVKNTSAIMLEVNCETDFVGRNKKFKALVENSTESCLSQVLKMSDVTSISKFVIESEELKSFTGGKDGKRLADHVALAISDLGENLNLRRAMCIKTPGDIKLAVYAHPSTDSNSSKIMTGKYGAIVAYKVDSDDPEIQQYARQLCQHVVGMNPKKVGVLGEDEPALNKDDEVAMIHQEFLLDPELTVGQLTSNIGLQIIDFARIECGEVEENAEAPQELRASG